MEKYLTTECINIGTGLIVAFVIIFISYLFLLRMRFLELINSIQTLTEALAREDSICIAEIAAATLPESKKRFTQLVVTPISAAISFIALFVLDKNDRHRLTVILLKALGFQNNMNQVMKHHIQATKDGWSLVAHYNIITGTGHPQPVQELITELTDPDTNYKIKSWKSART